MYSGARGSFRNLHPTDKKSTIDWTDVLNEEAVWHDYEDFKQWFESISNNGASLTIPSGAEFDRFRLELNFIREQAAHLYFGELPDVDGINERLQRVCLEIDSQAVAGTRLPALLAKGTDFLSRLSGALLAEFSAFAASQLGAIDEGTSKLSRCEGVYRDERYDSSSLSRYERIFRGEIPVLYENELLEDPAIQRCYDFFVGRPKARYCSDACRFNTFQITKQYKDPGYLAEKQRRYRKKLQS